MCMAPWKSTPQTQNCVFLLDGKLYFTVFIVCCLLFAVGDALSFVCLFSYGLSRESQHPRMNACFAGDTDCESKKVYLWRALPNTSARTCSGLYHT